MLHLTRPSVAGRGIVPSGGVGFAQVVLGGRWAAQVSTNPLASERARRVTLFEYLAIAYSLVFSSAAIRLVSGLPHAVHSGRRYYVHLLHVFLLLFALVLVFWSFWSFHDLQWNLFRFLSLLTGPGLLYFLACTLVPDSPSSVTSWRDHFFSIRRTYFLGLCLWFVPLSINTTMLLDLPLLHPARAVHLGILSMGVIGATTSSPVVHTIMAIGGMVVVLFAAAVLFLPGSLAG